MRLAVSTATPTPADWLSQWSGGRKLTVSSAAATSAAVVPEDWLRRLYPQMGTSAHDQGGHFGPRAQMQPVRQAAEEGSLDLLQLDGRPVLLAGRGLLPVQKRQTDQGQEGDVMSEGETRYTYRVDFNEYRGHVEVGTWDPQRCAQVEAPEVLQGEAVQVRAAVDVPQEVQNERVPVPLRQAPTGTTWSRW